MIELAGVSKNFTTNKQMVEAVKDVSLEVQKGEIYGVVGYSGARKKHAHPLY
ncbi:ABC transporter ATP-binding protein [Listeria floridensis FSL S10-1187]|uniref:ABC transporter ATP-binding protein n=1 Tax=Listeria floridensis FSL S10-1187 TaxID=1265817 RepID=A0ABN0RIL9_9LIST|nr:ABC transporter ATP-binding protein [Listeria floridensis FSL S10-1187]